METGILQNWTTAGGNASVLYVVQDEEQWMDMSGYADATFWIDVRAVNYPASATNYAFLGIQTAPFKDGDVFTQAIIDVPLVASQSAIAVQTLRGSSLCAPLARWVRWKVYTPSSPGNWSVTFRIRVAKSRTAFFNPMQLPGCQLWLRADAGVGAQSTLVPPATTATLSNTWVGWADMSGMTNGPGPISTGSLTYNLNPGGKPYIQSTTITPPILYLRQAFNASFGTSHTYFLVANIPVPSAIGGLFAATQGVLAGGLNSAFSFWCNTTPSFVGRTSSGTGVNIDAKLLTSSYFGSNTIFAHDANSKTSTSNLYINGTNEATAALTFTPGNPDHYSLFAQDGAGDQPILASLYEVILFNRQLSASEYTLVHRYLGARYGIAVP